MYDRCKWTYDEYHDYWDTECEEGFFIEGGSLKDSHIVFCCFCGKRIIEILMEDHE